MRLRAVVSLPVGYGYLDDTQGRDSREQEEREAGNGPIVCLWAADRLSDASTFGRAGKVMNSSWAVDLAERRAGREFSDSETSEDDHGNRRTSWPATKLAWGRKIARRMLMRSQLDSSSCL